MNLAECSVDHVRGAPVGSSGGRFGQCFAQDSGLGGCQGFNTLRHTHFRYSTLTKSLMHGNKAHVMQLMERPQYKDTSLLGVGCVRLRLLGGDVAEKGDLQCVAVGLSGKTTAQEPEEHQTQLTVCSYRVWVSTSHRLPVPALTASLLKEVLRCRRWGRRKGGEET